FASLAAFDAYLDSGAPLEAPAEKLFQGPIADALTHVGQIATRRRLAGVPIRGENYFVAEIVAGRVGPQQSAPRREFERGATASRCDLDRRRCAHRGSGTDSLAEQSAADSVHRRSVRRCSAHPPLPRRP